MARGPEAQTAFVAASRVVFSQILLDEKKGSAVAFLKAALAYYALCRSENWAKRAKVRRLVGSGGPLTIYLRKRRLRTANHGARPLTIRLKGLIASPLLSQIVQPKTIRRSRRAPSPLSRSSDVAKRKAMRASSRPCLWRWASLESVSALTAASACQMLRPVHA
ncbi:hypothetical protein GOA59_29785 [Sinorhizobium meliloti]|nr:hypothetical protein [Sinorhizobium meliloti]MDW9605918.1 hypothetical protein [Sinorhizobium meliloti]MDW9676886.1 hypothetical protein [Sinorhizobium meliloti]MDW9955775.1 hypothetical protein [Sinorhizobium meliloti]MDX0390513.1 hypothetical protein [Sinorhizobium meliloti]